MNIPGNCSQKSTSSSLDHHYIMLSSISSSLNYLSSIHQTIHSSDSKSQRVQRQWWKIRHHYRSESMAHFRKKTLGIVQQSKDMKSTRFLFYNYSKTVWYEH